MLYENYRKKIIKVADILKTVRKFRVLIITFLIALLCVMAVLLGIQGVVFDMSTPPAVIVYGQPFEYEAGAVMGSVRYEYAEEGSDEWTAAQPVRAGSYKVRAVAKGAFGGDRYGAEHSFTIEPKPIDVTLAESSAVYGEQPLLTADLAFSDVIRCVAFSYDYSQAEADISEGTEIRVFDENGEDVTSSYTFRSAEGTLLIEQRAVAITTDSAEKVYDGTPLTDTGYTVSADTPLAENDSVYIDDEADLTMQATITAAGSVENSLAFFFKKSITVDGEELFVDVTSNYAQEITYGTLTVKKRPVTFETASQSWVYDGEAHSNGGHVIAEGEGEYGLLNGHMMAVDESTLPQATDAGEVQNAFTIRIESAGEDMTDNYDVTYSYGTLTIKPRPVIFVTEGHKWVYDGTAHSWGGYSVAESAEEEYGLVEGHTSAAVGFTYVTNVADSGAANALTVAVYDGERDVTGNYAISYDEENAGKLTITPRSVTFVTEGHEWVYDGEAHSWGGHSVAQGSENGLAEGHTSEAVAFTYVTDVAESGTVNELTVAVYDGAEDVTANYEIAYDADGAGILTVTPRAVVIETATDEKVYDGTPLENGGCSDSGNGTYELVEGHSPVWDGEGTLPSVTDVLYDEAQHVIGLENIFAVRILDAGDTDRTDNYAIGYDYGTLTVTPRAVVIATATDKKVYDGTPLENGGCFDSGKGTYELVEGHSPVWDGNGTLPSVTDVLYEDGKVVGMENAFAVRILDADGTDRTDNYAVGYDYGTLTVTPRPITVRSDSAEKVYDAASLTAHGCEITEGTLAAEQTLTADYTGSVTNVWESAEENNLFTVTIRDAAENNVTANYAVTYEYGTLTITPRPIVVTAASGEKVYDAEPFGTDDFVGGEYYLVASDADPALAPPVVAGQTLAVETQLPESADVYEGGAHTVVSVTVWAGGTEVTANYAIRTENGAVTIKPRTVTFVTESRSWVYDGEAHSWDRHAVAPTSEHGLVEGHTSRATELVYITDVLYGEDGDVAGIPNALVIEVYDADGAPVAAGNYSILYECGTLTVTPRPIVVTAASGEKVYDGMPFGTDDFAGGEYYLVASGADPALDPPVAAGQTLEVGTQLPESADVYEGGAHTVVSVTVWADDTEVTKNYSIETADGTVTIAPRPIVVTAASGEKVYDGEPLIVDTFTVSSEYEPPLVLDHYADVQVEGASATDVCENVPNRVVSVHIYAGDGTDVTGNYAVTTKDGTLTITPRPITVTAGSDTKVYDGTPLTCSEATVSSALSPALVLDHEIRFAVSGSQTEIGESENTLIYAAVFTADGTDVSRNYQITEESGMLTVLVPGVLVVRTGGAEKIFDGTALTNAEYTIESTLGENFGMQFTVEVTCTGSQLHAGETENTADVRVTDASGKDVTEYTQIEYELGTLSVAPRPAKVVTGSQTWEYDGQPHSYPDETRIEAVEYDGVTYGLVQGHEAVFTDHAEIVMPGTMTNEVTVTVTDGGTIDFTDDYEFEYELGTLEIIDSSGGDGGGGGAGDLDTSGELGGGALGGEGNATVLRVRADVSEYVYFRLLSYGNYNGGGWVFAPEYGQLLDGTYSMNYLTGIALSQAGYTSSQIAIEMKTHDYLLPYYMATGAGNYEVQTSDVWYKGDTSAAYSLPFYAYDYVRDGALTAGLGGYAAAEEAYRAFVYENYLTVRESARACMQAIIAEQGFRADDPAIVAKVAAYIQNAAAYNLEYDRAMDDEADVVVAFLTKYKEGICQHYASAATLLFRELGIPARYTVGYVGETVAGEWAEIGAANAHAWVEVYIDGTGWVHVEVTGGGPGGGGGSGQQEELTIKPVNKTKKFDGTPLTADEVQGADEKSAMLLNELLTAGYTYKAEFAGSITEPGTTESTIESFVLYDPQGAEAENVTFTFEPGTLTVVSNILITIHPYVLQKYYDGTQLAYKADDYWVSGLQSGWRIEGFSMEGIGLTDVGAITADSDEILERLVGVRVYDESGILRTEGVDYTLVIDGSTLLTVDRRAITVSSYSDTKQYNGTPLTNDKCWISSGSLASRHILEATVTGSITDVGTKQNTIGKVIIRDGDGNDVTDNYKIVVSPGWLTVLDG